MTADRPDDSVTLRSIAPGGPGPRGWRFVIATLAGLLIGVAVAGLAALTFTVQVGDVVNYALRNDDILVDDNGRPQRIVRNTVGGNVQAFQNDARVLVRGNVIGGNLQCKENVPAPVGGGNIVDGSKEDQCARL